jgi:hypothetical protein
MIIIIIFILIGVIIGIISGINNKSIVAGILLGGFSSMMLGCFGCIIAIAIPAKTQRVCIEKHEIANLQDNSNIYGSFFLGCGSMDERMVYYSYVEENGLYYLKKFETKNVLIRFSNQTPHIESWVNAPIKGEIINYFAIDDPNYKYIFYIPQGSIKQNFNLDAQ